MSIEEVMSTRLTEDTETGFVESLQVQIEALKVKNERIKENHEKDIALIGKRLIEEAEKHDWCHEYDSAIQSMNEDLSVKLPSRYQIMTVTGTLTIPFRFTKQFVSTYSDEDVRQAIQSWYIDDYPGQTWYQRKIEIDSIERKEENDG